MNRLILALIISCGLTACSNNGTKKSASTDVEQTQPQEQKDRVEVLYSLIPQHYYKYNFLST